MIASVSARCRIEKIARLGGVLVAWALIASCGASRGAPIPTYHPANPDATAAAPIDTRSAISVEPSRVPVHAAAAPTSAAAPTAPAGDDFTCPMHLEVSATSAGRCPTCGMALKRRSLVEATR